MRGPFTGWQDAVLAVGGFVLALGLLPMLRAPADLKPPVASSLPISAVLAAYAVAMTLLRLRASAAAVGLQAALWGALVVQAW